MNSVAERGPNHGRYILVGQTPVPCEDILQWAEWMHQSESDHECQVKLSKVGPYFVSTVFLGVDHSYTRRGEPQVFETAVWIPKPDAEDPVFNREFLQFGNRCSTWLEAEAEHAKVIEEIRDSSDGIEELWPEPFVTALPGVA